MSNVKVTPKMALIIQSVVIIYTFAGVCGKMASGYNMLSLPFLLWFGGEIFILGVYAILWQQIIKRVDLSVAYTNRSLAIIWSMLWAYLLFSETIGIKNIIGVAVIVLGTLIVNSDRE